MKDIEAAFKECFDENITSVEEMNYSQNLVYLVTTDVYKYVVKKFVDNSEEAIADRREQLRISRVWDDHNIRCIQPLTDIFEYDGDYYIVYPYVEGETCDEGELTLDQIKEVATVQAQIHLMDLDSTLPNHIKKLNYTNKEIQDVIDECNKSVGASKNESCVCDNDFKPLNILWHNEKPFILDFDAVYMNHPTFSLLESAYTFCHNGEELNLDYYREYIKTYKENYDKEIKDIDAAVYGCWNGKIQWLKYLEENKPKDAGIKDLINQMKNYQKYVKDIKKILEEEC